jgi:hypothetical protein
MKSSLSSHGLLVGLGLLLPAGTGTNEALAGDSPPAISGPSELDPVPVPSPAHPAYTSGFIHDVAVVYQNGHEHAENVELVVLPSGETLLAFRGGGTGQPETQAARIRVFDFDPETYAGTLRSEAQMPPHDPQRGIRDPKLFLWQGMLALGAISREAGFPIRDLLSNARTVLSRSMDHGDSFTTPAFMTFWNSGDPTWGLWRYQTREFTDPLGGRRRSLYATGYDDGDTEAAYFISLDGGASFIKLGSIVDSPADVPSEAELVFLGPNQRTAVSLVRLDNQGLFSDGQTAICIKRAGPFGLFFWGDFSCDRRIEQRLDGPSEIIEVDGRYFVAARKHLACTRKRTALYEIRGDLLDPAAPVSLCEIAELPSNGDTAYVAIVPVHGRPREYVAAWYSTPLGLDMAWLPAQLAPSWILAARLDFDEYDPAICTPPPPDPVCPAAPLPAAKAYDLEGSFLLGLSPSFFPDVPSFFTVTATTGEGAITLTLQPLDHEKLRAGARVPVGEPFRGSSALAADGSFEIAFGSPRIPYQAYPMGGGNSVGLIHYVLEGFRLRGVTTSANTFCGGVDGNSVIASDTPGIIPPSTYFRLEGSTFGAARDAPLTSCSELPGNQRGHRVDRGLRGR